MSNEKILGADAAAVDGAGSSAPDAASHAAPWSVQYEPMGGYDTLSSAYRVLASDGDRVCDVDTRDYYDVIEGEDRYENKGDTSAKALRVAHLIAAAPELLEACKELTEFAKRQGWFHVAIESGEAALAKAEGRS
jgi:hypothetical protein